MISTKGKLIERFKSLPNDFTFDELIRLFAAFGFELSNNIKEEETFTMHKPHPDNCIKKGTLKGIRDYLDSKGLLE